MKKLIIIILLSLPLSLLAAQFTVNNTNQSGAGSLADAINQANSAGGANEIVFSIPTTDLNYNSTTGVFTITLTSPLPMLYAGNLTINGESQTTNIGNTNNDGPEINIRSNTSVDNAFTIVSFSNIISGFIISGFTYGTIIYGEYGYGNIVENCYYGTNYNGTEAVPNDYGVMILSGAYDNVVKNSLLSGNSVAGVMIKNADNNHMTGNHIGTDIFGVEMLSNECGIMLDSASNNTIGGALLTDRNIISGNTSCGVSISGRTSTNNTVENNYIGTDSTGTISLPNLYGVSISKAYKNIVGPDNLISGNEDIGVLLKGKYTRENYIVGNLIGTDITGTQLLHNDKGIILKSLANKNYIGGKTPEDRNIISGNLEIGIYIEAADSNYITGNYIGTDITGTQKVCINGDSLVQGNGVEFNTVAKQNILGGYEYGERNIISGHKVYGVVYYGNCNNNHTINNFIGTDVTSKISIPNATGICFDCASNHNDIINNVLSGNLSYGLFYVTRGTYYNRMFGNLVGVDSSGTMAVPNDIGMVVSTGTAYNQIGGDEEWQRNIFSGNYLSGIMITNQLTEYNLIKNNYFGTDITGTDSIPNLYGVMISTYCRKNTIDSNLISGNRLTGIIINEKSDSNTIVNNMIGTDVTGTQPLGNLSAGIFIDQGSKYNNIGNAEKPNIIANNGAPGILITHQDSKYNCISGNSIYNNEGLGIEIAPYGINSNDLTDSDVGAQDLLNMPVITEVIYDNNTGETRVAGALEHFNPSVCSIEIYIAEPDETGFGEGKQYIGTVIPNFNGVWSLITDQIVENDTVTCLTIDNLGNTSEFCFNMGVEAGFVYINQENPISFEIYPNPATECLIIKLNNLENIDNVSVYNTNGTLIYYNNQINSNSITWNLTNQNGQKVADGTYIVSMQSINGNAITKTIIIQ